jgi:hypothetical protein
VLVLKQRSRSSVSLSNKRAHSHELKHQEGSHSTSISLPQQTVSGQKPATLIILADFSFFFVMEEFYGTQCKNWLLLPNLCGKWCLPPAIVFSFLFPPCPNTRCQPHMAAHSHLTQPLPTPRYLAQPAHKTAW